MTQQPQAGSILVRFTPTSTATPQYYTLAGAQATPQQVPAGGPYEFTVTGLDCTRRYTFTVVANYATGTAKATAADATRPCVAPTAPTGIRVTTGSQHQLGVSWNASTNTGGGTVTYSVASNGARAATVTGTTYTVGGLTNFHTYNITVAAVNPAGSSVPPATASATVSPGTTWSGTITNDSTLQLHVRSRPDTNAGSVGAYPAGGGQRVDVVCRTPGGAWHDPVTTLAGSDWYQIRTPAGYVGAGYVNTSAAVWACA